MQDQEGIGNDTVKEGREWQKSCAYTDTSGTQQGNKVMVEANGWSALVAGGTEARHLGERKNAGKEIEERNW